MSKITSAGQIVPLFIVWDNIMPKVNEIKRRSKIFCQFTFWNPWLSIFFFCFFGGAKLCNKLGVANMLARNLIAIKLMIDCSFLTIFQNDQFSWWTEPDKNAEQNKIFHFDLLRFINIWSLLYMRLVPVRCLKIVAKVCRTYVPPQVLFCSWISLG